MRFGTSAAAHRCTAGNTVSLSFFSQSAPTRTHNYRPVVRCRIDTDVRRPILQRSLYLLKNLLFGIGPKSVSLNSRESPWWSATKSLKRLSMVQFEPRYDTFGQRGGGGNGESTRSQTTGGAEKTFT